MFKELKESIIFMTEWRGNVREINGNWSKKKGILELKHKVDMKCPLESGRSKSRVCKSECTSREII